MGLDDPSQSSFADLVPVDKTSGGPRHHQSANKTTERRSRKPSRANAVASPGPVVGRNFDFQAAQPFSGLPPRAGPAACGSGPPLRPPRRFTIAGKSPSQRDPPDFRSRGFFLFFFFFFLFFPFSDVLRQSLCGPTHGSGDADPHCTRGLRARRSVKFLSAIGGDGDPYRSATAL